MDSPLLESEWQTSKSLTTTRGGGFTGILSLREPVCGKPKVCLNTPSGLRPAGLRPVHSSPTRGGGFLEME
jgi:hypothetical protein